MKRFLLILFVCLQALISSASNAESIRWVTESWENFTNKDGSGLYHDILLAVFAEYQLEVEYIPWKRALNEVINGSADITGATSTIKGYISPRNPILAAPISILFKKNTFQYKDLSSLESVNGVWGSPYEDELFLGKDKEMFKGFSVQERETAYKLLISGRADYFLDTKVLHQAWLDSVEVKTEGKIKASDYTIVDISRLNLYMIFTNNARGQRLKDIFDQGVEKLNQQGQLTKMYEKYGFLEQMPLVLVNKHQSD